MPKATTKKSPRDDLEDYIAERTARNRDFPRLMKPLLNASVCFKIWVLPDVQHA